MLFTCANECLIEKLNLKHMDEKLVFDTWGCCEINVAEIWTEAHMAVADLFQV